MAQLSIYDKLRHHSDKDFTCSIGKRERIYITFRHETWKRFTSTEYISVYIGKGGALKFGDPKDTKMLAPCFKLQQGKAGNDDTRETTRYLQIEGKKYPAILDQVRRTAGSYDFPEPKNITIEEKKEENIEDIKAKLEANLKKIKENEIKLRAYTKEEAAADAFTVRQTLAIREPNRPNRPLLPSSTTRTSTSPIDTPSSCRPSSIASSTVLAEASYCFISRSPLRPVRPLFLCCQGSC